MAPSKAVKARFKRVVAGPQQRMGTLGQCSLIANQLVLRASRDARSAPSWLRVMALPRVFATSSRKAVSSLVKRRIARECTPSTPYRAPEEAANGNAHATLHAVVGESLWPGESSPQRQDPPRSRAVDPKRVAGLGIEPPLRSGRYRSIPCPTPARSSREGRRRGSVRAPSPSRRARPPG